MAAGIENAKTTTTNTYAGRAERGADGRLNKDAGTEAEARARSILQILFMNDMLTRKEGKADLVAARPRIRGQFCHRGTIGGCEKRGRPAG